MAWAPVSSPQPHNKSLLFLKVWVSIQSLLRFEAYHNDPSLLIRNENTAKTENTAMSWQHIKRWNVWLYCLSWLYSSSLDTNCMSIFFHSHCLFWILFLCLISSTLISHCVLKSKTPHVALTHWQRRTVLFREYNSWRLVKDICSEVSRAWNVLSLLWIFPTGHQPQTHLC